MLSAILGLGARGLSVLNLPAILPKGPNVDEAQADIERFSGGRPSQMGQTAKHGSICPAPLDRVADDIWRKVEARIREIGDELTLGLRLAATVHEHIVIRKQTIEEGAIPIHLRNVIVPCGLSEIGGLGRAGDRASGRKKDGEQCQSKVSLLLHVGSLHCCLAVRLSRSGATLISSLQRRSSNHQAEQNHREKVRKRTSQIVGEAGLRPG